MNIAAILKILADTLVDLQKGLSVVVLWLVTLFTKYYQRFISFLLGLVRVVLRALPPFLVSLVGGLMPVWLVAILLLEFGNWQGWRFFWINGEFYIYAAVFATQSAYLFFSHIVNPEVGGIKKKISYYLLALSFLVVVVSAVLYSALVTSNLAGGPSPDGGVLALSSLVLLFCAIAFVFGSEALRPEPSDPNNSVNEDIDDMYNGIKV